MVKLLWSAGLAEVGLKSRAAGWLYGHCNFSVENATEGLIAELSGT